MEQLMTREAVGADGLLDAYLFEDPAISEQLTDLVRADLTADNFYDLVVAGIYMDDEAAKSAMERFIAGSEPNVDAEPSVSDPLKPAARKIRDEALAFIEAPIREERPRMLYVKPDDVAQLRGLFNPQTLLDYARATHDEEPTGLDSADVDKISRFRTIVKELTILRGVVSESGDELSASERRELSNRHFGQAYGCFNGGRIDMSGYAAFAGVDELE